MLLRAFRSGWSCYYRAAQQLARASDFSAKDAQDLVVMAVAGSYLQVIAASARVDAARTQLDTAKALYQRSIWQLEFGKVAQIDVNRSRIEVLLNQERLTTLQNELAKQKITLARLTGLPPNEQYEISNSIPYSPAPALSLDDAIKQALEQRADLKAAEVQVTAAERALAAARAERLPSGSVSADYGGIGPPSELRRTYTVVATLSVPIWNGGRTGGDIAQAEAALAQRRAELEDMSLVILTAVLSALNSGLFASSRMLMALARRGDAPRAMARLDHRGVPVAAILASTTFGYVTVVMSYLSPNRIFAFLVNSYGTVAIFVYVLIAFAELRLRRRLERESPERLRIRMWGYPWLTCVAIAGMIAILAAMAVLADQRACSASG